MLRRWRSGVERRVSITCFIFVMNCMFWNIIPPNVIWLRRLLGTIDLILFVWKRPNSQILPTDYSGQLGLITFLYKNARGASGGIVIGFNNKFDLIEIWKGEFSLSVKIKRLADGWIQIVTIVYGPNDTQSHPLFWDEIRSIRNRCDSPWNIGGDFNITRFAHEKRGRDHHPRNREMFNEVITQTKLTDLPLNNRMFTWSDMRENPNLTRLDRVLVYDDWDKKFPLADLRSLERKISDHVPICLDSGENHTQ